MAGQARVVDDLERIKMSPVYQIRHGVLISALHTGWFEGCEIFKMFVLILKDPVAFSI